MQSLAVSLIGDLKSVSNHGIAVHPHLGPRPQFGTSLKEFY